MAADEEEEEGGVDNGACLLGKWVGKWGNEPILFRRILDGQKGNENGFAFFHVPRYRRD